jgi:hypothetical protein
MSRDRRRGAARAGAVCLCALLLAGCLLPGAADSAPDAEAQRTLERSVRFLQEAQNADGGFGGSKGKPSEPLVSAWATFALAAASVNPRDQAPPGGADAFSYVVSHTTALRQTTDFDRVALVALAAGTDPDDFASFHPIREILARRLSDGSFPQVADGTTGWINATAWSIFPLSVVKAPEAEAATRDAAEWLLAQQRPDGSWGSTTATSASDSDLTGATVEAIEAAGLEGPEVDEAEDEAFEYLRGMQGPDGGFRETIGGATNSATTAWVIQGMWAAGIDPRDWRTLSGADPLSFLASLQRPDGRIGWTATDDLNSLWMTAQTIPALAGQTYPPTAPARSSEAPERPAPAEERATGDAPPSQVSGDGGSEASSGDGVRAGGGGRGAPLFSAPQAQSGGSIPHGTRQVHARREPTQSPPVAPTSDPRAAQPPDSGSGEGAALGSGSPAAPGVGVRNRHARRQSSGPGTVEGLLVGDRGDGSAAAPGLFGADSGGRTETALALAIAAALALAAALGARRERTEAQP